MPRDEDTSASSLVGTLVAGRYRLLDALGAGGMGLVFGAMDERLQREVAVKVIRTGSAAFDVKAGKRFVREARAAAGLRDPRIVTVFDAGWEDGMPFLVMEKLEGQSLGARLSAGRMPAPDVAQVLTALLDGLSVAHAHGIVHRDIKPENVFLSARDGIKILDFGIAAVRKPHEPGPITAAGELLGTPLYMAPEQLLGAEPRPAMDVYAVGAVLYEALTGTCPYDATQIAELVAKKLTEEPRPVRELQPRGLLPEEEPLWLRLASVASRALERDPARRPSAREMRLEIAEAVRSSGPLGLAATLAAPPALDVRPPGRAGRRRVATKTIVLVVALLLAACAGLGAWAIGAGRSGPALEPAIGLAMLDKFHDASGSARFLEFRSVEQWRQAAEDFRRALDGRSDPPARWLAGLEFAEGQAHFCERDYESALRELRRAAASDPTWASPQIGIAEALIRTKRHEEGIEAAQRAERLDPEWWVPRATIAYAYLNSAEDDPTALARANRQYRMALGRTPDEPLLLDGFALTLRRQGLDDEAEATARRALARDPDVTFSRCVLAEIARERGHPEVALFEAQRALASFPDGVWAQVIRVEALLDLQRRDDADALFRRELAPLLERSHPLRARIERLSATLAGPPRGDH